MIDLLWNVCCKKNKDEESKNYISAAVPGAVQIDWAKANGWDDHNYSDNYKKYRFMEDMFWNYKTDFSLPEDITGKRIFFVSKGIDYEYEIYLNNELLIYHEGMFSYVDIDITDKVLKNNSIEILIYPAPKAEGAAEGTREEARESCKSTVGYGWDWHPRLIPLGIWDKTGIEIRETSFISDINVKYKLSDDLSSAEFLADVKIDGKAENIEYRIYDADGNLQNDDVKHSRFTHEAIKLWWCNGQGEQYLYTLEVTLLGAQGELLDKKTKRFGYKKLKLVMNEGAWNEPESFPKTRSVPPITIELNGRKIFGKGSNWVHPEIFHGIIDRNTYYPLVKYAKDAGFNIFRVWGGGIINKESWFDLCDEQGILVWQEFMLACNEYSEKEKYLKTLDIESKNIIKRIRNHPSLAIWGGGNELFNNWSGMTDQAPALRLLNKNCYELDPGTPFLPTSPLMGMGHGCYTFVYGDTGEEVYQAMQRSRFTAYTEFGVPSLTTAEQLRKVIPSDELFPPRESEAWVCHHAYKAWTDDAWLCIGTIEKYFGKANSIEELISQSQWLQSEGYKAIYEEARRQKPYCSMAINWCWCEPWICAVNNSLIAYPAIPKPAYYAVSASCRNTLASAKIKKFSYRPGEETELELWMLNDGPDTLRSGTVKAYVVSGNEKILFGDWQYPDTAANENIRGSVYTVKIPENASGEIKLLLECSDTEYSSEYRLKIV